MYYLCIINIKTFKIMASLKELRRKIGVNYLGGTTHSAKMRYSYNKGTMTYCIYLAPYNMSGYQVCGKGEHCKDFCLNGAGRNKADIIANGFEHSTINKARIKRTKAFYEDRECFMELLIKEIKSAMESAKRKNIKPKTGVENSLYFKPVLARSASAVFQSLFSNSFKSGLVISFSFLPFFFHARMILCWS